MLPIKGTQDNFPSRSPTPGPESRWGTCTKQPSRDDVSLDNDNGNPRMLPCEPVTNQNGTEISAYSDC